MNKYAFITDIENGRVEVGVGTDVEYYKSIGMEEMNVDKSEVDGNWYLYDKCPHYSEEEARRKEAERKAMLHLTKREVFLALYKDKGITPEQIKSQITDPQALIEFEYANDFYRGNPLIDVIGGMLGYTPEQLDYLFENGTFPVNDNNNGYQLGE